MVPRRRGLRKQKLLDGTRGAVYTERAVRAAALVSGYWFVMRYFLLDKVTELQPGQSARGVKNVTLTDEVLHDHFPDHPILPGALILEALAQLAGFLLEMTVNTAEAPLRRALLVQVDLAKFHDFAGPGDQIELTITLEALREGAAQVRAEARVGERRIARAGLTFVLREVESARVHEQRRYLYRLWTRDLKPPPAIR
jgi:3-hydroxyacyl-[acyl-carrier-protein] dehydratase